MRKPYPCLAVLLPLLCIGAALIYYLPSVRAGVIGRVQSGWARAKYALDPPQAEVFAPQATPITPFPLTPLATVTPSPTTTAAPTSAGPSATPEPTLPPTLTPTPPPSLARLDGIVYMAQMYNNCGPANLAMALSFWGWKGDQRDPAALLKPNVRDRNVMPYELAAYVEEQTDFGALVRVNGDLTLLKRFIAAGFPVIVEKGFEGSDFDGWMGHYLVVNGYDDAYQHVIVQDSFRGANLTVGYDQLNQEWRAFNYTYLVIYPTARGAEVTGILGPNIDVPYNYQAAAARAAAEVNTTQGRDLYFAWFNRASSLTGLQDYANAAVAFDAAFANYAAIPERQRPWRMLWYQTSPYFAYFYSQRFQDVINLADQTLEAMSEPVLEESYYWRAKAEAALGNVEAAIADYRRALKAHPGFTPAMDELRYLGEDPDA